MNADARMLFGQGDQAATRGEYATARACFLEAGQSAAGVQLWRSAIRCYRFALELDLLDREVLQRIVDIPIRSRAVGWLEYFDAVCRHPTWSSFGCRNAQIVIGGRATVECPRAGPVLVVKMPAADEVTAQPVDSWSAMPAAMAMIIVRRAMWPTPVGRGPDPRVLTVRYAAQAPVILDEYGEWSLPREPQAEAG